MALDTRRLNCLLLLIVLTLHVHHVLSQTTDSSSTFSITTISDLRTFFNASNSTSQLTTSFVTSLSPSPSSTSAQTTPITTTPYSSSDPPSLFTTVTTLTKHFRSYPIREGWNWRWCRRRRYCDFYRVRINVCQGHSNTCRKPNLADHRVRSSLFYLCKRPRHTSTLQGAPVPAAPEVVEEFKQ
jgi:hypothetical protein